MVFKAFDSKSPVINRIKSVNWSSPQERKQVVEQTLNLSKIPLRTFAEILEESSKGSGGSKAVEQCKCIAEVIKELSIEEIIPQFNHFFKCFTFDRDKIILDAVSEEVISNFSKEILDIFKNGDEKSRKAAFQIAVTKGKRQFFDGLSSIIYDGNWKSRKMGMFALREIGGSRAVPIFKKFLSMSDIEDKLYAIEILSSYPSSQSAQVLVNAMNDKNVEVRQKIAWSFGQLGHPSMIKHLLDYLDDEKWKIRITAIRSLGQIQDERTIGPLLHLLENKEPRIRQEAISVLGQIGEARAIAAIINRFRDIDPSVRDSALEALGSIGRENPDEQTKILIVVMQHESPHVRNRARDLMSIFGDKEIIRKCVLGLKKEDYWVRERVFAALLEMKEFDVFEPLLEILKEPDEILRRFAVEVLEKLGDPRSLLALIEVLKDRDWWVRERAIEALGDIGDRKAVKHLVPLLKNEEHRLILVQALTKIGDRRAVKPLLWILRKGHKEVKIETLKALEKIGDSSCLEPVKEMMEDPELAVRFEATNTLKRLRARLDREGKVDMKEISITDEKVVPLLDGLLITAKKHNATDLFLMADSQPYMKVHGEVQVVYPLHLSPQETAQIILGILNNEQKAIFRQLKDIDFSYIIERKGRFRVNVFRKKEGICAVFRIIPEEVPTIEELDLPEVLKEFCRLNQGLVLVTGGACQGKTTTLAAMIDYINHNRSLKIISIEEPIEYIHSNVKCQMTQREVGVHTFSFTNALRAALREDPDVICIGELRDLPSISIAITAAETGHLVLGTIHAFSASKTIDRIIDAFPMNQQRQIRIMLSENLKGVISQQLIKLRKREGRKAAMEVMFGTSAIKTLIRENKAHQIPSVMIASKEEGMVTMDQDLYQLVKNEEITMEEGLSRAHNVPDLEKLFEMDSEKRGKEKSKKEVIEIEEIPEIGTY